MTKKEQNTLAVRMRKAIAYVRPRKGFGTDDPTLFLLRDTLKGIIQLKEFSPRQFASSYNDQIPVLKR